MVMPHSQAEPWAQVCASNHTQATNSQRQRSSVICSLNSNFRAPLTLQARHMAPPLVPHPLLFQHHTRACTASNRPASSQAMCLTAANASVHAGKPSARPNGTLTSWDRHPTLLRNPIPTPRLFRDPAQAAPGACKRRSAAARSSQAPQGASPRHAGRAGGTRSHGPNQCRTPMQPTPSRVHTVHPSSQELAAARPGGQRGCRRMRPTAPRASWSRCRGAPWRATP